MRSALSVLLIAALTVSAVRAQAIDGVTFQIPAELASQQQRVTAATGAAVALLQDWFGPLPSGALNVTVTRWQGSDAATSQPGALLVPVRWLAPVRDQSTERALIAGVVRQYWDLPSPPTPFQDALVAYVSNQVIHRNLEGSNFAAPRFFGGHVSFPLRSVLLSPPIGDPRPRVWAFDDAGNERRREFEPQLKALSAIERLVGWPTMLQALSSMRAAGPSRWTAPVLGETLSTLMGIEARPVVQECFSGGDCSFEAAAPAPQSGVAAGEFDSPRSKLGVRLALHWLAWLQNAMLTYTAVV